MRRTNQTLATPFVAVLAVQHVSPPAAATAQPGNGRKYSVLTVGLGADEPPDPPAVPEPETAVVPAAKVRT